MILNSGAHSVVRKIVVTGLVGALSFPLTNLLFSSTAVQLVTSAGVGAVILIVQFLVDVDHRLAAIESRQTEHANNTREAVQRGFRKVSEATELFAEVESTGLKTDAITLLVRKATEIGPGVPPLVARFVQLEIDQLAYFLHGLAARHLSYEGEDRNWLLSLSRSAEQSIDAVSLPAVDAGDDTNSDGFWGSDLGHRYLQLQYEAVRRNVRVRRVFVIARHELERRPEALRACYEQAQLGIEVRLLYDTRLPPSLLCSDFILFDNQLSYEVTPDAGTEYTGSLISHTQLVLDRNLVADRRNTFAELWDNATALPEKPSVRQSWP
ncbi:MAG TPA: hypothetical protein VG756_24880 [Pseudonocardiaceae bacterium]|nr:hypothetical protein [Pseudonocardiaceae bacterium]